MATSRAKEAICSLVEDGTLILEKNAARYPLYTGLVTSADTLMVVEWNARNLQLYSRHDGKLLVTSDRLKSDPWGVCLISNKEVCVSLDNSKIVILSFKSIDDVKPVRTLDLTTVFDSCNAVAKVKSTDKLVVSGKKQDMTCWCVVSLTDGHVETIHTICKRGRSHLAIKNNTVYISCWSDESTVRGVYAYDIFNPHTQKFLYQHRELYTPCGLTVDTRGCIFVCDLNSNRIHQLTERGELVTIHRVSSSPFEIFYEDQQGVLYITSYSSNVITRYRLKYLHQPGIPIEILNMDDRSIQLFEEALKDGKETVCSIRVMVVGQFSVGKTTLIKRLLGEKVNISKRHSTEGVDVYVNCCNVSLSTGEWIRRIKDSEQDYQLQRLARVLNEQHSVRDKVADREQVLILPQGETTDSNASVTDKKQSQVGAYIAVEDKNTEVIYRRSPQQDFGQDLSSTASQQEESPSTETNTVTMLKSLQKNAYKLKKGAGKTSPLTVYDFAGQYAFYTTHQTFLTRRAIYLLVSDASKQLTDIVADECYLDSEGIMMCKVHELIEVWLNSIHSCAPFPEASTPPVILVGTHVDKISQKQSPAKGIESETQTTTLETAEFTLPTTGAYALPTVDQPKAQSKWRFWEWIPEKMRMRAEAKKRYRHQICERYFKDIRTCLKDKPTRFHLVDEDFAIDNTVVDSKLEDLKRKIVEVASQQSYWEEKIPARWLPLEQELMRLKAAGIKVILRSSLEDLNQTGAVPIATEELDLFLRFQHDIGTILYFSMDELREKIVLDPQWLIDALKSLITADEMFILRNTKAVSDKWCEFKMKGKLSPELIDAIWTKKKKLDFHNNKKHLLHLMEKLNIISKPRSYSEDGKEIKEEDYYLAPCMLRQAMPKEMISPELQPDMESTSVLCFMCTGKFLPPPIFHRLVGACLTHWPIAKQKSENLIYCCCCVFDLDHHHRLTLHFRDYLIFARVTRMADPDTTSSSKLCSNARKFIFENLSKITENLGQCLQFEIHIQCPDSDVGSLDGLIAVPLLQNNEKVPCHSHDQSHTLVSRELLQFWFHEERIRGKDGEDTEMNKNKAGLMKAETDQTQAVFVHDQLVQRAKSVGIIRSPKICGTGFRVGPCYIMTAKHVVDGIIKAAAVPIGQQTQRHQHHPLSNTNVFIDFSYEMDLNQTSDENLKFNFEPEIVYANNDLDTVILKLTPGIKKFPPPITKFINLPNDESQGYFIGHSNREIKKTDKYQCVKLNPHQIASAREWSMKRVNVDGFVGIDDSRRITLHCSFEKGASGSPGFWINPDDCQAYVLLMLLCGYPDWYYDEKYKDKRTGILNSDRIEQGVYMKSIYDDMKINNPSLYREIFYFHDEDQEMTPS